MISCANIPWENLKVGMRFKPNYTDRYWIIDNIDTINNTLTYTCYYTNGEVDFTKTVQRVNVSYWDRDFLVVEVEGFEL